MRVFFLDLWMDLREKRLAPLAIILLAAIIAVPLVLANGKSSPPPPPPTPTTASASAPTPVIQSQSEQVPSKLQTFSPRDPFEPTVRVAATTTTTTTTTSSSGSSSSGSSSSSSGSGTSTSSTPSSGSSGGATNGTQPSSGNTGSSNGNTGNTTPQTKVVLFTYTVDLRFGQAGDVKAYKNVKRLDLIPSSDNPKVVFLGVTTTGKTAVFLIDSNIGVDTAGGKCAPSADQCTFLYLRPDDSHNEAILTDSDGTVYHMRLLAIHRVSVSAANGKTTTGNSGSGNGTTRSKAFTGSADSSSSNASATMPGDGTPPGEPDKRSNFQQFFADSSTGGPSGTSGK